MVLRSCKLVKFFIQNLTGECVYLIEVPAYFAAVRFRINIAHDFLRENFKGNTAALDFRHLPAFLLALVLEVL